MGIKHLWDTNTVIYFLQQLFPPGAEKFMDHLLEEEQKTKTAELRKSYRIKLPDAIIAATAITYNQTLLGRNISDFGKINGLKVINPWDQ